MKMTTGQQMASQPQPQEGMPDMRNMMKYMIYFAPIMMMVFFNNYSSGLSLYYFVSNLLSIAIMFTIKNYILDERKIRQQIQFNKSQPVKPPSRFQRRMQAIMEEAERQKRTNSLRVRLKLILFSGINFDYLDKQVMDRPKCGCGNTQNPRLL